jgi:hypothetical protein
VVDAATGFVGKLQWRGNSRPDPGVEWRVGEYTDRDYPNDFVHWLRGGPEPHEQSTMSSWEALLFQPSELM